MVGRRHKRRRDVSVHNIGSKCRSLLKKKADCLEHSIRLARRDHPPDLPAHLLVRLSDPPIRSIDVRVYGRLQHSQPSDHDPSPPRILGQNCGPHLRIRVQNRTAIRARARVRARTLSSKGGRGESSRKFVTIEGKTNFSAKYFDPKSTVRG